MFIKHTSCDKCGSSDAKALYKGGSSFCFSCRRPGGGDISPYVFNNLHGEALDEQIVLPVDAGFNYSSNCLDWVFNYGVTVDELIKHKVYWSTSREQLLFTFYDEEGTLLLWQARNFGPPKEGRKPLKYFTKGKPDSILPIYRRMGNVLGRDESSSMPSLVIVEDCISAIKISRYASAMPVLGSSMSSAKLTRLSHLPGLHRALVWLDGNMFHKAQAIVGKLQMLGIEAKAIYTELDPKEYDDNFIRQTIS